MGYAAAPSTQKHHMPHPSKDHVLGVHASPMQAGHLDALLRCTSQPQAYNQGPQPQANCSLVLSPSSPAPQVLHWTIAPSSTRPPPQLCAVHAAAKEGSAARPPAFTPDMPEGEQAAAAAKC
jgi:hypothetical protein